jgi:CubicO group peptidase (beta-lactamase class C family)
MSHLLLCLLLFGTPDNSRLSTTLDSLIAPNFQGNVPGMAVLVASHGKVMYKKAFGSANIELGVPLSPDMVFKIGSISKQFTAVGVLRLAEQGKIHLTDSIQQYISDYPWKRHRITIENLLTHTSGIVDYMSLDDPDPYAERRDWKPDQLIHYFDGLPLQFEPGTKYSYTNSGYTVLAYIIQKVTGIPFHTYMKDRKKPGLPFGLPMAPILIMVTRGLWIHWPASHAFITRVKSTVLYPWRNISPTRICTFAP